MYILALVLVAACPAHCRPSKSPVRVTVEADWGHCNGALAGIGEYIAQTTASAYWDFVTTVSEAEGLESVIGRWGPFGSNDGLLQRLIRDNHFAARLEAIRASVLEPPPCDPYIVLDGAVQCTPSKALSRPTSQQSPRVELLAFDKVHGEHPRFLIVGSIGREATREAVKQAIQLGYSFAFRPLVATCTGAVQTFASSFGLSLEVRSAIEFGDDAHTKDKSLSHVGFQSRSTDHSLMALKTIQLVQSSSDPPAALCILSTNYPLFKDTIAAVKPDQQTVDRLRATSRQFPHDHPVLYINGLAAQAEFVDAHSLGRLMMLVRRHAVTAAMLDRGLLPTWLRKRQPVFSFPIDQSVVVLNDLERDARYRRWPGDIAEIFRLSRTVFKIAALNLATCILVVDVKSGGYKQVIANAIELVEQNIPIRFALFPSNVDRVGLAYFYGLLSNLGLSEALKFILNIDDAHGYAAQNPRIRSVTFLQECSRHKEAQVALQQHQQLAQQFDLLNQPGHFALLNGRPLQLIGADSFEDNLAIFRAYQEEMDHLRLMLKSGAITGDEDDLYDAVLRAKQSVRLDRSHASYAPLSLHVDHQDGPFVDSTLFVEAPSGEAVEVANRFGSTTRLAVCANQTADGFSHQEALDGHPVVLRSECRPGMFYASSGRRVQIHHNVSEADVALIKRFDAVLTHHLAAFEDPPGARAVQSRLVRDLTEEMRALFPTLEPEQPTAELGDPIVFGDPAALIRMTVVVNPLSTFCQRLVSLLHDFGPKQVHAKVYLNGPVEGSEPAFNAMYRWVGRGEAPPVNASFVFALQPDCPASWALTVREASGDLDNLRYGEPAKAVYKLQALTVEGNAVNRATGGPAAGQKVELWSSGSGGGGGKTDESIVMGNFGYYQLRATPGTHTLRTFNNEWRTVVVDRLDAILLDRLKVFPICFYLHV